VTHPAGDVSDPGRQLTDHLPPPKFQQRQAWTYTVKVHRCHMALPVLLFAGTGWSLCAPTS